MKKLFYKAKEESGAVIVIVALALVGLLSFSSLAIDLGLAYYQKSNLQAAVDSAALAAVYKLPDTNAATIVAKEYIQKNGFDSTDVNVTFDIENSTCTVYSRQDMSTVFANIINVSSLDMSALATSKLYEVPGAHSPALDYCLFSGDESYTLNLGGVFDIYGNVHSNGQFSVSPSRGYVQGSLEASHGGYFNQWTASAGEIVYDAPVITMPDFTDCINQVLPSTYTVVNSSNYSKISSRVIINDNIKAIGNLSISNGLTLNGNLYVEGDLTISGGSPVLNLYNGSIYCTGNIKFGNTVAVDGGCIFAAGNIQFSGSTNTFTNNESVALYSQNGSISLTAAGVEYHGIVYAPKGSVYLAGDNLRFYGNVIANRITGIPAYLNMSPIDYDLPFDVSSETTTYSSLIE